ncbi:type VI secretion system baseplate subunit TssK [Escherichia coli]
MSPRAVNLPLHLRDGIWQADIHDTELLQSATFVLAVAANMPVDQIQRQFIQQSKISSPEKSAIWSVCRSLGISARTDGGPPPASLPFRVQRSNSTRAARP